MIYNNSDIQEFPIFLTNKSWLVEASENFSKKIAKIYTRKNQQTETNYLRDRQFPK